jgi:hypothetical protein
MTGLNPYRIPAGTELDALIHEHVMGNAPTGLPCPSYSTNKRDAARVEGRLRSFYRTVVISGKTELRDKPWFARYESDSRDGTEVLAETYPLAVCRLALLKATSGRK